MPNPTQQEMYEKIRRFFNENVCDNESEKEDFSSITSVTLYEEKEKRIKCLEELLATMKGSASSLLYSSFIKLVLLLNLYKKKLDDEENDIDGEEVLKNELSVVIKTKERPSLFIKKSKKFYTIASKCKKNSWKDCNVAPSFWRDIQNDQWGNLLDELNLN